MKKGGDADIMTRWGRESQRLDQTADTTVRPAAFSSSSAFSFSPLSGTPPWLFSLSAKISCHVFLERSILIMALI